MTTYVFALLLLWLIACAIQDYRTGEVSNWLTLPPLALSLAARLAGWLSTPWWHIVLVWILTLFLWLTGKLGGADAKAWMTLSLLGDGIILSASIGLVLWYAAVSWAFAYLEIEGTQRLPGFPGYLLGVSGTALILTIQRIFPIMFPVASFLSGYFSSACQRDWRFFV